MNEILLNLHLSAHQNDFVQFMQIDSFPKYKVQTKTLSLLTAASQGYESAATSQYLPKTKKHILTFGNNIALHKQLVYHEFTHILDAEIYARGDSSRYAMLSGFTEYHASQVELMKLLGAKTTTEQISFSMDTIIDTVVGKITVFKYIEDKRLHAVQLFNRTDFPADLPTLKTAVSLLQQIDICMDGWITMISKSA